MIFAFVFTLALFPSEIVLLQKPCWAASPLGAVALEAAGQCPGRGGSLSSGAPRDKHPRDAAARGSKGLPPPTALPQPSLLLEACKVPAKILRLEEC